MMTQQRHQPRLFDVRHVPLAPDPDRRDWLDRLRGALPPFAPPARPARGGWPFVALFVTAVAQGAFVGLVSGAITATALYAPFPVLLLIAPAAGAAYGLVIAVLPTIVLSTIVTAAAAWRHNPLLNPRQFHRAIWRILLVGVAALDAVAFMKFGGGDRRLVAVGFGGLTAVVVLLLRPAARRIVVAYIEASGWIPPRLRLGAGQGLFRRNVGVAAQGRG